MTSAAIDLGLQLFHFTPVKFDLEVFVVDVTCQIVGPTLLLFLVFFDHGFLLLLQLIDRMLTLAPLQFDFHNLFRLHFDLFLLVLAHIFESIKLNNEMLLLHFKTLALSVAESLDILTLTLELYGLLLLFFLDFVEALK